MVKNKNKNLKIPKFGYREKFTNPKTSVNLKLYKLKLDIA